MTTMYDTGTKEGQEKRKLYFARQKLANLKEWYAKTRNKKYLLIAESEFGVGDYIPGYDDGEQRVISNHE